MEPSASEKLVKTTAEETSAKMQKEKEKDNEYVTRKEFLALNKDLAGRISSIHDSLSELTSLFKMLKPAERDRAISPAGDKDKKEEAISSDASASKQAPAPEIFDSSHVYSRSLRKSRGKSPEKRSRSSQDYESEDLDRQETAFANRYGDMHKDLQAYLRGKPIRSKRDSYEEQSDEDYDQHKTSSKSTRRKSILDEIDIVPEQETNKVLYTAIQPSYDHIKLHKRTPEAVMLFVQKYRRYQLLHNIELKMTRLISENVANMVISGTKGLLSEVAYYDLPNKILLGLLMHPIRPKDKVAFIEYMNANIIFELPRGYVPLAEDFAPMYHALLTYRRVFKDMFDLLADNNEEVNIPKINNKENGVVRLFTTKVGEWAINVVKNFENTNYDYLEEFLVPFYTVVQTDFEDYEKLVKNKQKFKKGGVAASSSSNSSAVVVRPASHDKFKSSRSSSYSADNRRQSSSYSSARPQHRVSHIREEVLDDEVIDEGDRVQSMIDSMIKASDMKYDYPPSDDDAVVVAWDNDVDEVPFHYADYDDDEVEESVTVEIYRRHIDQLAAIKSAQASAKASGSALPPMPNGCYQAVLLNKCSKTSCTYSHEPVVLARTHHAIQKLLNTSIHRPQPKAMAPSSRDTMTVHNGHKQVLRRPPAAADTRDSRTEFSNMMMVSTLPTADEFMFAPHFGDTLRQMTLAAMPEVSLYSLMHREGVIDLPNAVRLPVLKTLFDTGALHGSYISSSYVEKHRDLLEPFLRRCNMVVTLADNKTKLKIDSVAVLDVCFIGDDDVEHTGKVPFCVLEDCANDMIIGLPAIASKFSSLLKQMIDEAVLLEAPPMLAAIEDAPPPAAMIAIEDSPPAAETIVDDGKKLAPDVVYPWSIPIQAEAPEDIQTELPCSFPDALHFMEMSPKEALKEYLGQIPKHVAREFIEATDIVKLLTTKGARVFVPQNWDGINGIPPLILTLKDGMPATMKPKPRSINPKLYDNAFKEFQRLLGYFYAPSSSPIASCLVIAPKATPPFIRFCGDYTGINKFIMIGHYPIPHVQRSLEKITKFKIFLDFDLVNAFHQIRLALETSMLLSVQTPWGQVHPLFMPEGIGPASGILQALISEIFSDLDWVIAIFDNLLALAHDYDDACKKVEIILDRCIERNIYLKLPKTWLGFTEAKFFGYVCRHGCYELSQDRKDALKAIPFPRNTKQMQSFLGAALFFKSFVPNYSSLTAPLNDMIKNGFSWDQSTWKIDYAHIFDEFKTRLQEAQAIFYPDYALPWILRTDASLHGVGAVLLQIYHATPESEPEYQPIAFVSQKFSEQATRWSTIEQECFGLYFGVKSFEYYLRCKPFILETDHNNLLWIEHSMIPKVIRWRVFLQSFTFQLRHIAGKLNTFADWLSRAHESVPPPPSTLAVQLTLLSHVFAGEVEYHFHHHMKQTSLNKIAIETSSAAELVPADTPDKATALFKQVHGGRMGHFGARETWRMLNKYFPGHQLSYRMISELVATCAVCQKDRLGMLDVIAPVIRHLKQTNKRAMIGLDSLTITPVDKDGNCLLTVIVNFFTKHVALYPGKDHSALTVATALFQYCCTYGLIDAIITDPGSEFMNEVVAHLLKWLGIPHHRVSLVDRHESNGVEGTNKLVLRFLKALVMDERVKDRWSSPTVLPLVQFLLNSRDSSETGIVPFHAHFGSADATYFRMPEEGDELHRAHAYVKLLDSNLRLLSDISNKYQQNLAKERTSETPAEKQNMYQPGDLILFQLNPNESLPSKLTPKFYGPYEVISQVKNDITCKHIILGHVKVFHVTRVKMFHGSLPEAKRMAMLDNDQYVITRFVAYRGDPDVRTTMEFEVLFEDGSLVWLPWSKDLFETSQYEDYCRSRSELFTLVHDVKTAAKLLQDLRKAPITEVEPGDIVYVDLRSYGAAWYATLPLPDLHHIQYVLEYKYVKWVGSTKRKIDARCDVFRERFDVDHVFVRRYGSQKVIVKSDMTVLIDADLVRKYPTLMPGAKSSDTTA